MSVPIPFLALIELREFKRRVIIPYNVEYNSLHCDLQYLRDSKHGSGGMCLHTEKL